MSIILVPYLTQILNRVLSSQRALNADTPFGSGQAGTVTYSTNQTLTLPFLQYNNLTINAAVNMTMNASAGTFFVVLVKNTLTVAGTIHVNGLGGAAGAVAGAGGNGAFTTWDSFVPSALAGATGGSGAAGTGFFTGGGGAATLTHGNGGSISQKYANLLACMSKDELMKFRMTGSGGGGGADTNGGGGAGAGSLIIIARNIVVASGGVIKADGNAGSADPASGAGGGGGGGGSLHLLYKSLSNAGTISANGGAGGADSHASTSAGGTSLIANPFSYNAGTDGIDGSGGSPPPSGTGGGGASGIIIPIQI